MQGAVAAGVVFTVGTSQNLDVTRMRFPVPGLPKPLSGFRVAFASDFHHGVYVPAETLRGAVDTINALRPHAILLGGDYVTASSTFFDSAFDELACLRAPHGVFSVPGNHEYWTSVSKYRKTLGRTRIVDLTNRGVALGASSAPLWVAGLDDDWGGGPDPSAAVAGAPHGACRIAFTHNPVTADELPPGYANLILAGHTHGWQVYVPGVTRFLIPSSSMRKYRAGFYDTPAGRMYVTRGVGTIGVPVRVWCRPEVVLVELAAA
jgi:hypothetical protein